MINIMKKLSTALNSKTFISGFKRKTNERVTHLHNSTDYITHWK